MKTHLMVCSILVALAPVTACDSKTDCTKCPSAAATAPAPDKDKDKAGNAPTGKPAGGGEPAAKPAPEPAGKPAAAPAAPDVPKGEGVALTAPGGVTLKTVGAVPAKDAVAPDFRVARFVPGQRIPETAKWSQTWKGKPTIVSVVPSLDTPVCETQTSMLQSKFADGNYQDKAVLVTVSKDLPFAMARFAETHPGATLLYSDYKYGDLGTAWGLEVAETGLLARSVWLLDGDGVVVYSEVVENQASEPQYDPVFAALDAALGAGNK